jgi:hypothetical protein
MDDGCAATGVQGALRVEGVAGDDLDTRRDEVAGPLWVADDRAGRPVFCDEALYDGRAEPACRAEDDVQLAANETLVLLRARRAAGTNAASRDRAALTGARP